MYHVNKLLACYQRIIRGVKIILYCSDEGSVICIQPMGITETWCPTSPPHVANQNERLSQDTRNNHW